MSSKTLYTFSFKSESQKEFKRIQKDLKMVFEYMFSFTTIFIKTPLLKV